MLGQLAVGAFVIVAGVLGPGWPPSLVIVARIVGAALAAAGVVLFLVGIGSLGGSLTPFPKPRDDSVLKEGGAYRFVRHPIYGGVLLVATGWSFLTSPLALFVTVALAILLDRKARHEEVLLQGRYAGYEMYRQRVRWRFVPGIR